MKKVIVILISMLIIFCTILIQTNFLNNLPFLGIVPNVGLVLVCALGITAGPTIGGVCGVSYGVIIDSFFGRAFGIFALLYLIVGIGSGYLKNTISKDNKMSLIFMVLIGTAFFEICTYIFSIVIYKIDTDFLYLLKVIVIEEIYNMFLTYVLFRPLVFWGETINRTRDGYYLLH